MASDFLGIEASHWLAAAAAVIVSVALFYFGHRRSKKSEQIRISRDLWQDIRTQNRFIHEWPLKNDQSADSLMKLISALESLEDDLRYFVHLIEIEEIKEPIILEYYGIQLHAVKVYSNVEFIGKQHPMMKEYTWGILGLIKEYHSLLAKKKKYKISFRRTEQQQQQVDSDKEDTTMEGVY